MSIEEEDFEAWRDNPVTMAVFKAFDRLGRQAMDQWLAVSWKQGHCDPVLLADLRARAEVVEDFRKIDFSTLEAWLNDDE